MSSMPHGPPPPTRDEPGEAGPGLPGWQPGLERNLPLPEPTGNGSGAGARRDDLGDALDRATAAVLARIDRRRPELVVREELAPVTDEAIAALRAQPLYVRARMLVQLGQADGLEDPASRLTRPAGAPVIVPLTQASLRDLLDRAARWVKPAGRKQTQRVAALPPAWVAEQILARTAWPFPPLEGVVATPVLRPDGTVLDAPGYDLATGLYYDPVGTFPSIPAVAARRDAETALQLLLEPVKDFPFTDVCGRAAYVAAVLSLVGRPAIDGPVPGFPISSPAPGTGKGLLARVISIIGTGRPPAVMAQSREDDELRKRVLAIALAGTSLVLLDNLSGVLGSDVLAAALTSTTWSDRMLGVSTIVEAPLQAVWLFTGNNLTFKKTLGRRMVPLYLDARVEHPEDRTGFAVDDLVGWVQAARPALVVAALTILRAFARARRPRHGRPPMGSFEAWDDWVRGCCVWLGLADPAQADNPLVGRGRIRAELDEDLGDLGELLAALSDSFGEATFVTAQVAEHAKADEALRTALEAVGAVNRSGHLTATAIGYRFRAAQDRIVDGHQLVTDRSDRHAKRRLWRVVTGADPRGTRGMAGDVLGPPRPDKSHDLLEGVGWESSPPSPPSPADPEERYGV